MFNINVIFHVFPSPLSLFGAQAVLSETYRNAQTATGSLVPFGGTLEHSHGGTQMRKR